MKHLRLLLIIIMAGTLWTEGAFAVCGYPSREMARDDAIRLTKEIKEKMQSEMVEDEVEELRAIFEGCNIDRRSFGLGSGIFEFWKKTGRENETCTTIRLDQNGGPVSNMPVMDQGESGICYAYASAQLIDAWRFAHGDTRTDHLTSPMQLAALYKAKVPDKISKVNSRSSEDVLNSGQVSVTVKQAFRVGSCSSSRTNSLMSNADVSSSIRKLVDSYRDNRNKVINEEEAFNKICETFPETVASSATNKFLKDIRNTLNAGGEQFYLYYLVNALCKPPEEHKIDIEPKADFKAYIAKEGTDLETHINKSKKLVDTALEGSPATPPGIGYASKVLKDPSVKCMEKDGKTADSECGLHGSIIIGRKRNPKSKKCEYLVRNSWGTSCNSYPDLECESGNIWVPETNLFRNSSDVYRLEKK